MRTEVAVVTVAQAGKNLALARPFEFREPKSPSSGESDLDLRTRFEQIYQRDVRYVSRLLARLGVPPNDIEDSVQDVFLAYLRCEIPPTAPAATRALLFGIAQRVRWGRLRWLQRHEPPRHRAMDVLDPSALMDPREAHPEARLLFSEAARLIARAAARLSPKQREVLELGGFERLTATQIAKILGTSPNTVASRLRTARLELAREVARLRLEPGAPGGRECAGAMAAKWSRLESSPEAEPQE
jgi:RNA polymerase sigma-70 factor (ECF subfamily)